MQKKRIVLGMLDTQGFEMVNRVYSGGALPRQKERRIARFMF